ncbi:MAG: hypothetical protein ACRBCK_06105 [Alphaproteobacteria bacterium]
MRKGPHPLPVHLGLIAANMKGIEQYTKCFDARLEQDDAVQVVRGIQMYQKHPHVRTEPEYDLIWQDGTTSIKGIKEEPTKPLSSEYPLLLVPSLINKAHILDICAQKSMLRWFNERGIKAYLFDWGDLSQDTESHDIDIEHIIKSKLSVAIRHVSKMHGKEVDVLGYCMGGTLLLGANMYASVQIRRMVLLATPWDFHEPSSTLARNVRLWSPYAVDTIEKNKTLPAEWVQTLFASLDVKGSAQKFMRFATMDQGSSEAKLFVLVEDWLNDGVDLPAPIAQHCIQKWFAGNVLVKNEWRIGNDLFNPNDVKSSIFLIASEKDQLVPYDCALNVKGNLVNAQVDVKKLQCGHIGLIVGRNAQKQVWEPIAEWLAKK